MSRHATAKRVVTILWSAGLAVVLIVVTTSVMLSSTKRARISVEEREEMMRAAEAGRAMAATTPSAASQPSENWFGDSPRISSSKVGVFDLDKARGRLGAPATQPAEATVEVSAVFRFDG